MTRVFDLSGFLVLPFWALMILGVLLAAFGYYLKTRADAEGGTESPTDGSTISTQTFPDDTALGTASDTANPAPADTP